MRRAFQVSAWILASVATLAMLSAVMLLVAGNTASGRAMIERITYRLTAGTVKLSGLGGSFPADLTLAELQLIDKRGVWLTADRISVHWSPWALLERRIAVQTLQVGRLDMERTPQTEKSSGSPYVPHIDVAQFSIDVLQLGEELAGRPATLSVRGGGRLRSLEDAEADVVAHRTDSDGEYTLHLRFDSSRMDGTLAVHEPASGPLENILQLPGLGALAANLSINGPRNAERINLTLSAGDLSARAEGSVDLRRGSADLDYSLEAPAVSPRSDLHWQSIGLKGRWHGTFTDPTADGHLQVDKLELPGGAYVAALSADLTAANGVISVHGVIDGLRIPGPQASLFERDPLKIDASWKVSEATRPLVVAVTHRLFSLKAQAVTAGRQSATLDLHLPNVAPFAALAGQDVKGDAALKAQIDRRSSDIGLTLDGNAGISGGSADWIGIVGNHVGVSLSGALSDASIALERLQFAGRAWRLSASGTATRPGAAGATAAQTQAGVKDYIKDLKARWDLHISDLGIVGSEFGGNLQASGQVSGVLTSLAADATVKSSLSIRGSPLGAVSAELHARGVPTAPNATVRAQGTLDGSPLELAASLERGARGGLRVSIQRGVWKSARLEGELAMESGIADTHGQIRLQVSQLTDFESLLRTNLRGSLDGNVSLSPKAGHTHAQFQLDGRDLAAGPFSGTLHLTGEGATDAVTVQLNVQSPDVAGSPADMSANALIDFNAQEFRVVGAAADYRGQKFRLLAPARLSYKSGFTIDQLKLGAQDAVLRIDGELAPSLELRASLQHVNPKLINVFLPDVVSEGTIEGQAHLQGSLSAPTGHIGVTAHGVRFASDGALGLPALNLDAGADLAGDTATIDARLNAGTAPLITVSGRVPLNAQGAYDLKMIGKLDIGVVNPLFEARGMHEAGQLVVDATLGGNLAQPQIRGTITLSKGNLRDYARGLNLSDINAEVFGNEGTLQIKSFKATAASGSFNMTGSIGALQPGIPVDLKITANNAQPITSNLITANLDADIHVSGTARQKLAVAGKIHLNRALIGIPDSLPPDVAVLDVRRRGRHAQVPEGHLEIGLDIAIQAPRQILVQGRGLDAELGGDLHIGGTTDAPLVSGGFDLQRGSFTVASTKLILTPPGRLSFDGTGLRNTIDPTLDFSTAQTTVASATVMLQIRGYASSPKFEFISTPQGMPQDEIMALLLFGKPASQLSALEVAQIGAALATLSGVGGTGSNPLVRLQKSLGLDRLSVASNTTTSATGTPENSGAAVQAGRYISKRIYVEGKQSTTGQSQVEVDVDLTKHLKLQTRLGNGSAIQGTTPENDPGSSIGLSYQFEY